MDVSSEESIQVGQIIIALEVPNSWKQQHVLLMATIAVQGAAEEVAKQQHQHLDLLLNVAGLLHVPGKPHMPG
jgi:hypothetical protein